MCATEVAALNILLLSTHGQEKTSAQRACNARPCYEVTFVNPANLPKVQIYNCAKYQRHVKGAERKQSRGLAILLYVDWLPQANGFAASSIIYRRGSLSQKTVLVPT